MSHTSAVSLTFEASAGCQLNCAGCRVDKTQTSLPTDEQFSRLLSLFDDLERHGFTMAEFELGPTDLVSTSNRAELFCDERLARLARKFQLLALNAGMVYPGAYEYVQFADQVWQLAPGTTVSLVVPIDLKHVFNEKYVGRLRANVERFCAALRNPFRETILKVIFDEHYMDRGDEGRYTYQQLFEQVQSLELGPRSKVDFAFHHGRDWKISDPIVSRNFLRSLRGINEAYLQDLRARGLQAQTRHLPFQLTNHAPSGELVYNSGELYVRPVLNERMNVFHELMRFKGEWSAQNYHAQTFERLTNNLSLAMSYEQCASCEFVPTCASKNLHELMHLTHTRQCISLLRQCGELNAVLEDAEFFTPSAQVFEKLIQK